MPRAFDPAQGQDARDLFPDLPTDLSDLMAGAGGSSPYLLRLMHVEPDWIRAALEDPEAAARAELDAMKTGGFDQIGARLRQSKRRIALLIALADLGGIWPLEQVTGTLTDFAALACDLALKAALAPLIARGKLPGKDEGALETAAGMTVLAMGKMGAGELNYSSDIDLICLFDQDQFAPEDYQGARASFIKATRAMAKTLSDVTADGYVFRTDLRLRPDPAVTPVCMAVEAAERYYESLGRTWERAAYIKARPVAGDLQVGADFLDTLSPFVWRKHLDFAAIEDAHNMRLAIREHKGTGGPITLPGHHMKLGRGGIREIEFYTQTRQLIAGGRDPDLRVKGTVEGLRALAAKDWVALDLADDLADHYRFHRDVEHRVQMVQDAQTHTLPRSDPEFERLACLMGMPRAKLETSLLDRLSAVHSATEGFFAPDKVDEDAAPNVELITEDMMTRWLAYPALRSPRARGLLTRLRPELEQRLAQSARPEDALIALEGFFAGLPAGVQLLSLFEANPHLIDLVLDVVVTSPALADHLSRNAQVLDGVIGGGFFEDWPGIDALEQNLAESLDAHADDYEAMLDTARSWMKEWHFRIGVHMLRGLTDASEAGAQYGDLARAVLRGLWGRVHQHFAQRHGPAPGRGAVILGMGALGMGRMNAGSDLDLIVIYDAEGQESSEGRRPLATRLYFARLTQALITAISAQMSRGRLYEVDMRLRPSGNQGPVATSLTSFQNYQTDEAWTWEHLALSRAAVIAGPKGLAEDVAAIRDTVLTAPRDLAGLARDVQDMRTRIAAAKSAQSWLDVKAGPGMMQDIDLLAQTGALLATPPPRDVQGGLAGLVAHGGLTQGDADALCQHHALFWQVTQAHRLLGVSPNQDDTLGDGAREFLLRLTGQASLDALRTAISHAQANASDVIHHTLDAIAGTDKT